MAGTRAPLRVALLTQGNPAQLTGGHLYQERMARAATDHDAELRFMTVAQRPVPIGLIEAGRRVRNLVDCQVLVVDSIAAAMASPWLPAIARQLPVVGLVHQQPGGADSGRIKTALQARLDLRTYRRAQRLIVVSEFLADRLRAAGVRPERITIIPPGRDAADASALISKSALRGGRRSALLCVSNWTRNKNIHVLLEALASFQADLATLHLVGSTSVDPGYSRQLLARIATPELRERVVVHGAQPPDQVAGLLAAADLFVHPSRHEAYGSAVAEALAIGTPVIAFRVDNLPYLVRDGIDGILLPIGQTPALAAAIALLAADPPRRAALSASARSRAASWPTWTETADRFFDELRRLARR